jgi:hypothetical protein
MFHATEILSLFEPVEEKRRFIYEIVLKPSGKPSGHPIQSPRILQSLEAGQTRGGYSLEGLIHWPGGLLVRLHLSHSYDLEKLVDFLRDQSGESWESEPVSIRLIHPDLAESPANAFTCQMDRIRQSLDPSPFPSVGLFYYHRPFRGSAATAA